MARVSYLVRREGRYYLQVRCGPTVANLLDQPLRRTSLKTADYRQPRCRIAECLFWIYSMNDSADFAALFAKNVQQLQTYLADRLPLPEDRLFARHHRAARSAVPSLRHRRDRQRQLAIQKPRRRPCRPRASRLRNLG
jgi:hypothetical protein